MTENSSSCALFEIDPELLKRDLLEVLSPPVYWVDLYIEYKKNLRINGSYQKINTIQQGVISGFGIRVITEEGFRYYHESNTIMERIRNALRCMRQWDSPRFSPNATLQEEFETLPCDTVDADDIRERKQILLMAFESAWEYDKKIQQVEGDYYESAKEIILVNTDGIIKRDFRSYQNLYVESFANHKNCRGRGISYAGCGRSGVEYFTNDRTASAGRASAEQAVCRMEAREIKPGHYPVIIHHGWGGMLWHEACGHGLEADFIVNGTSIYTQAIGKPIASGLVSVVDDGVFPDGRGTSDFDDEGCPSQQTLLIEKGVLRTFMTDRKSAEKLKVNPTGNGRRENFQNIPLPRMTNTYMLPGSDDPEGLIRSVKKGIFAKQLGEGRIDILSGDFIFEITDGYMIENGHVTFPLKNMLMQGNGPRLLNEITGVGYDLKVETGTGMCTKAGQQIPVSVGQPTIKIREMAINLQK
jgi:TldD protein